MRFPIFGEHVVTGVIAANSGLLAWELVGDSLVAENLESACLAFFVGELVWRLSRNPAGWRNKWFMFDALVIGLSVLPLTGADTSLLRVARLSPRAIHLLRHATHLRWVRYLPSVSRKLIPHILDRSGEGQVMVSS